MLDPRFTASFSCGCGREAAIKKLKQLTREEGQTYSLTPAGEGFVLRISDRAAGVRNAFRPVTTLRLEERAKDCTVHLTFAPRKWVRGFFAAWLLFIAVLTAAAAMWGGLHLRLLGPLGLGAFGMLLVHFGLRFSAQACLRDVFHSFQDGKPPKLNGMVR